MSENLSQQSEINGADVSAADLLYLFDTSLTGKARSRKITTKQLHRAIADGYNAQTWAGGTLTLAPADFVQTHREVVTVALGAGDYTLTVTDGTALTRFAGNTLAILFRLPGVMGVSIQVQNSSGDDLGEPIYDDGSGNPQLVELYHDGAKWQGWRITNPTNF